LSDRKDKDFGRTAASAGSEPPSVAADRTQPIRVPRQCTRTAAQAEGFSNRVTSENRAVFRAPVAN